MCLLGSWFYNLLMLIISIQSFNPSSSEHFMYTAGLFFCFFEWVHAELLKRILALRLLTTCVCMCKDSNIINVKLIYRKIPNWKWSQMKTTNCSAWLSTRWSFNIVDVVVQWPCINQMGRKQWIQNANRLSKVINIPIFSMH